MICQAWVDGVSTRKVDQLIRALGNDTGISRSTVSRICQEIDESVQEFLHRRIDHTWFPYLFLDATYVPWNAPFYATCGFVETVPDSDFHRGLAAHEEELGLTRLGRRVEMSAEL